MVTYNQTKIGQDLDTYVLKHNPTCTRQQFLDKIESLYGGEIKQITAKNKA